LFEDRLLHRFGKFLRKKKTDSWRLAANTSDRQSLLPCFILHAGRNNAGKDRRSPWRPARDGFPAQSSGKNVPGQIIFYSHAANLHTQTCNNQPNPADNPRRRQANQTPSGVRNTKAHSTINQERSVISPGPRRFAPPTAALLRSGREGNQANDPFPGGGPRPSDRTGFRKNQLKIGKSNSQNRRRPQRGDRLSSAAGFGPLTTHTEWFGDYLLTSYRTILTTAREEQKPLINN